MFPLRVRLIVLVLMAAILGMSAAPIAAASHAPCMVARHDCDNTPAIAECCCGADESSLPSSLPQPTASVAPTMVAVSPVISDAMDIFRAPACGGLACAISPRHCLLDLPTLFSTLLI